MTRPKFNPWLVLAFAAGTAYPLLVYFGASFFPPMLFVLLGLAILGVRLFVMRHNPNIKIWKIAFCIASFGLVGMLFLNSRLAVQAYPVVVSLSVASIFGLSLIYPPSMVERIARLTEPDLPPEGVIYTRRVTLVWVLFLLVNASISTATSLWGTLTQWTLWNGLISYLLMGTLFIGEIIVRRMVRR